MAIPNPPGFDPAKVREALRFPMRMEKVGSGITFVLEPAVTSNFTDFYGVPLDPADIEGVTVYPTTLNALCAYEGLSSGDTRIDRKGPDAKPLRFVVTILDEDYEPVKDHIGIIADGIFYARDTTVPSIGLFSITVYQIYYKSLDS
jgi:hypothetical protein